MGSVVANRDRIDWLVYDASITIGLQFGGTQASGDGDVVASANRYYMPVIGTSTRFGLAAWDVSTVTAPVQVGISDPTDFGAIRNACRYDNSHIIAGGDAGATSTNGFYVFDVATDPDVPALLVTQATSGGPKPRVVFPIGDNHCMVLSTNTSPRYLLIFDMTTPSAPVETARINSSTVTELADLAIDGRGFRIGDHVLLMSSTLGVVAVDVTNKAAPTVTGTFAPANADMSSPPTVPGDARLHPVSASVVGFAAFDSVNGNEAFWFIDVSDPATAMTLAGSCGQYTFGNYPMPSGVDGGIMFCTGGGSSINAMGRVDISTPTAPKAIGWTYEYLPANPGSSPHGAVHNGHLLFGTTGTRLYSVQIAP